MLVYELCVLFRIMPRPELIGSLKRVADCIYDKGGVIRKLENLGTRDTPYRINVQSGVHKQASYFTMQFSAPPKTIADLEEEYNRDVDVLRCKIFKLEQPPKEECTLHEELKPAPYRKSVQALIAQAKRQEKPKFKYNSGLDYYPFQK